MVASEVLSLAGLPAEAAKEITGVAQVGEAITHTDQATQKNAALVEEMTAASSLKSQAQDDEWETF